MSRLDCVQRGELSVDKEISYFSEVERKCFQCRNYSLKGDEISKSEYLYDFSNFYYVIIKQYGLNHLF